MKSKEQLIAEQVEGRVVVDIGYAQDANLYLKGDVYGVDIVVTPKPPNYKDVYRVDLNADQLPFEDESVDTVAMGCTLAHVSNPLRVMAECNRVLKPGGRLIVSSPNPNYYIETIINAFYHQFKARMGYTKHIAHFFEFTRYTMRTIARRCGFEVKDEIGVTFYVAKLGIKFNPIRFPGLAYEIVYVMKKVREPQGFATFEVSGIRTDEIATDLFR